MLTVNKLLPQGQGLASVLLKRAATIELDWDVRQKSRFDATDSTGRALGVFLPRGTVVRGGDVLVAEDGTMIRVQAAPQPVLVITPCAAHGSVAGYFLWTEHRAHLAGALPFVLLLACPLMHVFMHHGHGHGQHGPHQHGSTGEQNDSPAPKTGDRP